MIDSSVAVAFAQLLRGAGVDVPVGATVVFAEALSAVGLHRRDHVYWAGFTTLLRKPEDRVVYDRAFAVFWEHQHAFAEMHEEIVQPFVIAIDDPDADDPDDIANESPVDDAGDVPTITIRWSDREVLQQRDFAAYTDDEFNEAAELMTAMRLGSSQQRSRRLRRSHSARRGHPDVQRTVRFALRTEGEPIRRFYRERSTKPRRIVLLLDVSGSMEPYARAFVRFVHASVLSRKRVEVFALGTRLTRVTRELQSRDPDAALRAAAQRVTDWAGGTRLGAGLAAFNDEWGVRGMARGADVVILSDGWDRGEPQLLGDQMQRLQRVAHRVIWVNPLKASEGYAPLAQGMAAAMPYIDTFIEGHSLDALANLSTVIGTEAR